MGTYAGSRLTGAAADDVRDDVAQAEDDFLDVFTDIYGQELSNVQGRRL
ncbi:hypothetical protein [Roseibium hamelinense]|nr:hypothetical protein [Roseibium hamelinense]